MGSVPGVDSGPDESDSEEDVWRAVQEALADEDLGGTIDGRAYVTISDVLEKSSFSSHQTVHDRLTDLRVDDESGIEYTEVAGTAVYWFDESKYQASQSNQTRPSLWDKRNPVNATDGLGPDHIEMGNYRPGLTLMAQSRFVESGIADPQSRREVSFANWGSLIFDFMALAAISGILFALLAGMLQNFGIDFSPLIMAAFGVLVLLLVPFLTATVPLKFGLLSRRDSATGGYEHGGLLEGKWPDKQAARWLAYVFNLPIRTENEANKTRWAGAFVLVSGLAVAALFTLSAYVWANGGDAAVSAAVLRARDIALYSAFYLPILALAFVTIIRLGLCRRTIPGWIRAAVSRLRGGEQ